MVTHTITILQHALRGIKIFDVTGLLLITFSGLIFAIFANFTQIRENMSMRKI